MSPAITQMVNIEIPLLAQFFQVRSVAQGPLMKKASSVKKEVMAANSRMFLFFSLSGNKNKTVTYKTPIATPLGSERSIRNITAVIIPAERTLCMFFVFTISVEDFKYPYLCQVLPPSRQSYKLNLKKKLWFFCSKDGVVAIDIRKDYQVRVIYHGTFQRTSNPSK